MPGSTEKQVLGRDLAVVVRLEIVEMRARAVDFMGDVVAGAMGKVVCKAGSADDGASRIVSFESADRAVFGEGLLDGIDGCVAGVAHGLKDELLALGGLAANDSSPGDVVINAFGVVDLAPDVDEQEVAFFDFCGAFGGRFVVRVGAVGVDADVGSVLPDKVLAAFMPSLSHCTMSNSVSLPCLPLRGTQAAADLFPAFFKDFVDGFLSDGVAGDLAFS